MADKVGSIYVEIRAQIQRLSRDLAEAQRSVETSMSRMQQSVDRGISLMEIGAKVAAAALSIRAALQSISAAAEDLALGERLLRQEQAFESLAQKAGKSSRDILSALSSAARGMATQAEIIESAGTAMMLGIPADKLVDMMRIAEVTSRQTGQTVTEAFSDIARGMARQSKAILDNLGIIVDAEKAYEQYAQRLGKTAEALTEVERRQAFWNAVLESGIDLVDKIGEAGSAIGGMNKLLSAQSDLWAEVKKAASFYLNDTLERIAEKIRGITEWIREWRETRPLRDALAAREEIDKLATSARLGFISEDVVWQKRLEYERKYGSPSEAEIAAQRRYEEWRAPDWWASWREREGTYGELTSSELERIREASAAARKEWKRGVQKATRAAEQPAAEVEKYQEEFRRALLYGGEGSNVERMEAMLRSGSMIAQMEAEAARESERAWVEAFQRENRAIAERSKAYSDEVKKIVEAERRKQAIIEDTADVMAQRFADAFAGVITGTEKLSDAFRRMADSIIASLIRMQIQSAAESGLKAFAGLFAGSAAELPINQPGFPGAETFHTGGVVGMSGGSVRRVPDHVWSFAPRLHGGLMPGEFPAILERGETVLPRGASVGGNTYYYISAIDTQSFVSALRRSGAVPLLAAEDVRRNGALRGAIMERG